MLRLRRASCSKIPHKLVSCPFSHHARSQSLSTDTLDVRSTSLDTVILGSDHTRHGYSRSRPLLSPHQLLRQLGPSKVVREQNLAAYDADNIKRMRERYVTPAARVGSQYYKAMEEMRQIELQALEIGRQIARRSKDAVLLRRTFRRLFEHCSTVPDIMKVLALAFQRPSSAEQLQALAVPIIRAIFRARIYDTDLRIHSILYALILRMEKAGLTVDHLIFKHCAKFAARSRDPTAMQRALWLLRSRNVHVDYKTFRAIVAKFSIGRYGFGELRNGRWKKKDVLSALLGFEGTRIKGGEVLDHHLGSFLKREDWAYLDAWVQILARCRATDLLWKEWMLCRSLPLQKLDISRRRNPQLHGQRERLDAYFIDHMLIGGDVRKAWTILSESKLDFWRLNVDTRTRLFDDAENLHLTTDTFDDPNCLRTALLEKYAHDLECIERKLGIVWRSDGEGGGRHVVPSLEEMERRWEELSRPDFGRVYGYFSEDSVDQEKKS